MKTIPNPERKEWRQLLLGEINPKLKNFFFQMKVEQSRHLVETGRKSLEEAVKELYDLAVKFSSAKNMDEDIVQIFGSLEEFKTKDEPVVSATGPVVAKTEVVEENSEVNPVADSEVTSKPHAEKLDELERLKKELLEREKRIRRKQLELEEKLAKERMRRRMQAMQEERQISQPAVRPAAPEKTLEKKVTPPADTTKPQDNKTAQPVKEMPDKKEQKVLFSRKKMPKKLDPALLREKSQEEQKRLERVHREVDVNNQANKKSFIQRLLGK